MRQALIRIPIDCFNDIIANKVKFEGFENISIDTMWIDVECDSIVLKVRGNNDNLYKMCNGEVAIPYKSVDVLKGRKTTIKLTPWK